MLKKEQILKILKKYGFYSLNRAPYLYQHKEEFGVYFLWPHLHYGNLERVLFFEDEESLEEEVYKYWWFLNHKNQIDIEIQFNNYEILSPQVNYLIDNVSYSREMMKNYKKQDSKKGETRVSLRLKKLERTATIIISILKEKFKLQNDTYFKVLELQENLNQLKNEYNKKFSELQKDSTSFSEAYELLSDEEDDSSKLANTLQNELLECHTDEELLNFIQMLFSYLVSVETSEVNIQNNYLLQRYPYEIEDIKKKIEILDNSLSSKKRVMKQKQNIMDLLEDVDKNSACKKMINVNLYIDKEKKRIEDLYNQCKSINEVNLGDYILNFANANIIVPPMIEEPEYKIDISKEELCSQVKQQYASLSKKEKAACHVAASFLKESLNILSDFSDLNLLSPSEVISRLIVNKQIDVFKDGYHYIEHYLNTKFRVKYMSILKIDSFENFIVSLIDVLQILDKINLQLAHSLNGYYNHKEKEILPFYLKNLSYFELKESYIIEIQKNTNIYYSPIQILKPLDILENNELVLRENEMFFLLKHKVNIQTTDDKICVVKYNKNKVIKKKDYICITEMKVKNECIFYNDVITKKEGISI